MCSSGKPAGLGAAPVGAGLSWIRARAEAAPTTAHQCLRAESPEDPRVPQPNGAAVRYGNGQGGAAPSAGGEGPGVAWESSGKWGSTRLHADIFNFTFNY